MDKQEYLTMKDLMNFHYCPRLIYFENVLKIPQVTTIKEFKGRELHQAFEQKSKRNKIVKEFPKLPKQYDVYLESANLNFRTVLDCLMIDKQRNEAFPLEYKDAKKPEKIYWTFKIQVFAESLLVKEMLNYSVPAAFIKFEHSGDLVKLLISEKELSKVKETVYEINKIIETERIPDSTPFQKRCKDCCYWRICKRA